MKQAILSVLLAAALVTPVVAQQKADVGTTQSLASAATAADLTDGVVRKVNKDTGKITIRHGEIKNLAMPPMTMVFQVKDPALLDKAKAGDKVRFRAEEIGGALVVIAIEPVR